MFDHYILKHTSRQLHTLVRLWSLDHPDRIRFDNIPDFSDLSYGQAIVPHADEILGKSRCCIFSLAGDFAYSLLSDSAQSDRKEISEWALIGPLRFDTPVFFQHSLSFQQIGVRERPSDYEEWLKTVPICSLKDLLSLLLLILNAGQPDDGSRTYITENQLLLTNCVNPEALNSISRQLARISFEHLEDGIVHNPWNHEARQTLCIEHGDVEGLRKVLQEDYTGRLGTLAHTQLRQAIDMGIVTITIASRAAIRGGLHAETAFYLSDISIQNMEKCIDVETVKQIYNAAQFRYAELVRDLKKELPDDRPEMENEHISRCKDYIYTHLHGVLTVAEIADAIGLNANYLSTLFRRTCGVSLKEYILKLSQIVVPQPETRLQAV